MVRIVTLNPKVGITVFFMTMVVIAVDMPFGSFSLLALFPVFFYHMNRKDIGFLKFIFHRNWFIIVLLENLIIFTIISSLNPYYIYDVKTLISVVFIVVLSFFASGTNKRFSLDWSILPKSIFEWKSYFRKNTILILLLYPVFIASAYNSITLFIGALFIMDPIIHVFKHNENKEMLELYFSQLSLNEKLKANTLFYNICLLPLYALFAVLNTEFFYIILYYIVFINLFHLLIITRKYELYAHDKSMTEYYYISTFYENMFLALLILPAIGAIKERRKSGLKNIEDYAGNTKH